MSPIFASTFNAPSSGGPAAGRIHLLDLLRSVCVWMMLVYHTVYDLTLFGVLPGTVLAHLAARAYCYLGAGGFLLISGVCVRFSRDSVRRGFLVFCAGFAVTVATTLAGYPVRFGVLQLLGCCMVLYGLAKRRLEAWNGPIFVFVCLVLFFASWALTSAIRVDITFLYPLGLRAAGFSSADYFPLLPWAFLFLLGTAAGKYLDARRDAPPLRRRFPAVLTFCGRHSLMIYLLHQPLIYGFFRLIWD